MDVNKIAKAISTVKTGGIHDPDILADEIQNVNQCLTKTGLGSRYWAERLESEVADYCGRQGAVAVSTGTAGLHLALLAAGVSANQEVFVPSVTFAATAAAVCYTGAVPHFIDTTSLTLDKVRNLVYYIENYTRPNKNGRGRVNPVTGRVIQTLVVVDLLGVPAQWPHIEQVADEYGLTVIEDACQALGSSHGLRMCGSFGALSVISFNNNKIVTGGGGGVVLSDDERYVAKIRSLAAASRVPHPWLVETDDVGYNYRIPEMCAACASAQLARINKILRAKGALKAAYRWTILCAVPDNDHMTIIDRDSVEIRQNDWLIAIKLKEKAIPYREALLTSLHEHGVKARAMFTPLHMLQPYKDCPCMPMGYSNDIARTVVCLPSGVNVT